MSRSLRLIVLCVLICLGGFCYGWIAKISPEFEGSERYEKVENIDDAGRVTKKTVGYHVRNLQTGELIKVGRWTVSINGQECIVETFDENGKNHGETTNVIHGVIVLRQNFKHGVKHGVYQMFSPQGVLIVSCVFKDGVLDGQAIERDLNGTVIKSTEYVNGQDQFKIIEGNQVDVLPSQRTIATLDDKSVERTVKPTSWPRISRLIARQSGRENYAPLPGDISYEERIAELIQEANAGKLSSLLTLGRADIRKEKLLSELKRTLRWPGGDGERNCVTQVMAKLGDEPSRVKIHGLFHSEVYGDQEDGVQALNYIQDEWALKILAGGLSLPGGERQIFADETVINAAALKDRPLRFSCLAALGDAFTHAPMNTDKTSATEADIQQMIAWLKDE